MPKSTRDITTFDANTIEQNVSNGFKDLDTKEKGFAIEYVTNGYNHRDAAKSCGFSANDGARLKRNPLVAAYINSLMDKYTAQSVVRRNTLDAYLDELEDIAMARTKTIAGKSYSDNEGNFYSEDLKMFHPTLALKIYQERSRLHGVVKEESAGGGSVSVTINMQGMTGSQDNPPVIEVQGEVVEDE